MSKFNYAQVIISSMTTLLFVTSIQAQTVLIIHPENESSFDAATVKRIFLGKEKTFSSGREALPINQKANSPSRASFDTQFLNRSTAQMRAYWSKLIFTGKGTPPKEVLDDAAVLDIVSSNVDAIGYVEVSSVSNKVKTIELSN